MPSDPPLTAEFAVLGMLPGEEIEVVQAMPWRGPILVLTARGIYALGWALANGVLVAERP